MSTLSINVKSGLLNKNYDIVGKMQNYVYFKLIADGKSQQYKTKIVPGQQRKPIVWNQTINMNVPRNDWSKARLQVQIKDQDISSDQVCARGFINLQHCGFFRQQGVSVPYTIRLYNQKNDAVAGQLTFANTLI